MRGNDVRQERARHRGAARRRTKARRRRRSSGGGRRAAGATPKRATATGREGGCESRRCLIGRRRSKPGGAAGGEKDPWADDSGGGGGSADGKSAFSDAVALQFPRDGPPRTRKPYFIFGDKADAGGPVVRRPREAKARRRTTRPTAATGSTLGPARRHGRGKFDKGEWRSVFKRRAQGETTFEPGGFLPIAFSVWDGGSRERGNKRGLTNWWSLYFSPRREAVAVGRDGEVAVLAFVLELAFIVGLGAARGSAR